MRGVDLDSTAAWSILMAVRDRRLNHVDFIHYWLAQIDYWEGVRLPNPPRLRVAQAAVDFFAQSLATAPLKPKPVVVDGDDLTMVAVA